MRPVPSRFVTIILLIGQLLIGVVPGRSHFVPLSTCAEHTGAQHVAGHDADHCHSADRTRSVCPSSSGGALPARVTHCHDEHGDFALGSEAPLHDGFGCHLHVPDFGSDQLLALAQHVEQVPAALPLRCSIGVVALLDWGAYLAVPLPPVHRPPDLSESEQARALRVTCLLI